MPYHEKNKGQMPSNTARTLSEMQGGTRIRQDAVCQEETRRGVEWNNEDAEPDVKRKSIERPRAGIKDRAKPDPEQDKNAERDARQGIEKSPEVIRQDGANLHNQRGDKSAEPEVRRRSGIRPGNTPQEKTR